MKWDGYRLMARKRGHLVRLWSRNGRNWADMFPFIVDAIKALPTDSVVIDGEAVCLRPDGRPVFHALRSKASCRSARLVAFDLLGFDGHDLRAKPLQDRRIDLATLLNDEPHEGLWFSSHVEGQEGEALFRHACQSNLEGIVSKRLSRPYRSGPCRDWLKIRCGDYHRL
jgi:bifunctional non-homologous end joining protein LigD